MKEKNREHITLDFFNKSNPGEKKIRLNERTDKVKASLPKFEPNHDYYVLFIKKYCESLFDDLSYLIADRDLLVDIKSVLEKIISNVEKKRYKLVEFYMVAEYEALVRTLYSKLENLVNDGVGRKKALYAIRTGVSLSKRKLQSTNRNGNCKEKLVLLDGTISYEMNTVNGFDFVLILDKHKYLSKNRIKLLEKRFTFIFGEVKSTSSYYGSTAPKFLYHTPAFQSANLVTKYLTIHGHLNRYLKNNRAISFQDFKILYNELFELYLKSLNTSRLAKQKYKLNNYATPYYLFTKSEDGIPIVLPLDPLQISNTKVIYNFAEADRLFPQGVVDNNFKIDNKIFEKFHPERWPKFRIQKSNINGNPQICKETNNLIEKIGLQELKMKEMYTVFQFTQGYDNCSYRIDNEIVQKVINASLQFLSIVLPKSYTLLETELKVKIRKFENQYHGIVIVDKSGNGKRNLKSCIVLALRNMNHKLPVTVDGKKSFLSIDGNYLALSKQRRSESLYYLAERLVSQYRQSEFIDDEQFWTKICIVMSIGVKCGHIRSASILGSNVAISQFSEFQGLPFEVNSPVKTLIRKKSKINRNIIPTKKRRRRKKIGSPNSLAQIRFKNNLDIMSDTLENKNKWKLAVKRMNALAAAFEGRGKYFSAKYFQNLSSVQDTFNQWLIDGNYEESWKIRLTDIFENKLNGEKDISNLRTMKHEIVLSPLKKQGEMTYYVAADWWSIYQGLKLEGLSLRKINNIIDGNFRNQVYSNYRLPYYKFRKLEDKTNLKFSITNDNK